MIVSKFKQCIYAASLASLLVAAGCKQDPSLTPFPASPTSTLTIASVNPATGVAVTAVPADNNSVSSGNSSLTLTYYTGTAVVLTAPAVSGLSTFSSWTGCTSSSSLTCSITLAANTTVTANYTPPPVLTVTSANPTFGVNISVSPNDANGAGAGTTTFTRTYGTGTAITLTAPATAGSTTFGSWSGCSTSSGPTCNVTLTANRTIAANYVTPSQNFNLTVNSTNPASGVSITASPADVNAKSSSTTGGTFSYPSGSTVTLTAPANSGSTIFQGWSGCSPAVANSLTCSVAMTSAKTVTAKYFTAPVGHTYYVSPSGNDSNSGLSTATAFLTLQQAANTTQPGDVVYALTGTYKGANVTSTVLGINTPGTAAAPIAYRAYPGNTPTLSFSSFTGIGFGSTAAYIEVNGFTVNGNNQNVTLAQASTADAIANPGNYPQFNGNCIFADGRTSTSKPNHLSILNNVVSNCGAGIGLNGVDYVTISGNTVFNCAWYDAYGTSAISILASYNSDTSTATKIVITGNKVYNNYELIPYHVTNPLAISDGEGIIIDTNMNSSITTSGITYAAYTGRTLIANNVIFDNGSSAIEIYASAHVDVVNNSTYGNLHTPVATAVSTTTGLNYAPPSGRGELAVLSASDVNVYNNILYSYTGQNPYNVTGCASGCGLTANYNMYYNGSNIGNAVNGANDLYANPVYVNALTGNLPAADLSLVVGSPAIDSGTATLAPATDFNGTPRPQGLGYDRGAFER
jgi:parallel beta-helix repeat protein